MAINKVTEIKPGIMDQHGHKGNGDGGNGMEARLAKLEANVGHIQSDITDIKTDIREVKKDAKEEFRIIFGAMIVIALGLAGIMAKGFHWLN